VAVAEPSADHRTPAAAAVLDDLAVGFATATTINLRGCDRGLFPFPFSWLEQFRGPSSGSVTVTITGAVEISKKNNQVQTCFFFFLVGQFQSQIAIELCDRGSRTVTLLHAKFCGCVFFFG
jgi:hypothetical protein